MRRTIAITLSVLLWTISGCAPAETGPRDPEEQFQLGEDHQRGRDIPKDPAAALEWYRKAADQGHPTAQVRLAMRYAQGRGVKKNPDEARRLFRLAADQGQPRAQFELGIAYRDGHGVPKDLVQAEAWLMLSEHFGSRVGRFMGTQLRAQLTAEQMEEARGIVHEWRAAYFSSRARKAEGPRGG